MAERRQERAAARPAAARRPGPATARDGAFWLLCRGGTLLAAAAGLGCVSIVDNFSGRTESCAIAAIGKPATGTIARLIDTGTTINDDPVVEFVVLVAPAEGPKYEARAKALISRLDVPAFQPGRVVPLKYDPQDPRRVALDLWSCPTPRQGAM